MENISKIWLGPLPTSSPYVKPLRFFYIQNGVEKNWDLMKVHDSVAIIIYNIQRNVLVFVRQFRPAVFYSLITSKNTDLNDIDLGKFPPSLGVTLELCAGIIDKEKSCREIAREEMLEECGYDVVPERIEEILTYRSGVGSTGAEQKMFYCEVTDADKLTTGGGVGDELIEVVEYYIDEIREMLRKGSEINSPPSCLMGMMWFLMNKSPVYTPKTIQT